MYQVTQKSLPTTLGSSLNPPLIQTQAGKSPIPEFFSLCLFFLLLLLLLHKESLDSSGEHVYSLAFPSGPIFANINLKFRDVATNLG